MTTDSSLASRSADASPKQVVKLRHAGRWITATIILILVGWAALVVASNPRFGFGVVGQYVFSGTVVSGVLLTLELTIIAMVIGILLGTLLAIGRMCPNPIIMGACSLYVWAFRGTPVLVQLILWYNFSALFPTVSIGLPFGPPLISGSANSLVTPLAAAILGLGLNEGAYMAEIVRAGIQSVDHGQVEAAHSLGLTHSQTLRKVVLPQAMRLIVPPTGNELISMLKTTSLVSVLAISDLLYSVQAIYARTYQTIPLLIVASLWYLALTMILSVAQQYLERHLGKSNRAATARSSAFSKAGLRGRDRKVATADGN